MSELDLMPIRVGRGQFARRIELRYLFAGEIPADGAEVLPELLFVTRADNDAGHGGGFARSNLARAAHCALIVDLIPKILFVRRFHRFRQISETEISLGKSAGICNLRITSL